MRRVVLATGVELAVAEFGTGEAMLLLHAWGETHRSFDRLVPLLSGHLHLILADQRGVGDSAKPAGGYTFQEAVDDVVALLDALNLDTCWLLGTSSGGYLAQQVAIDHPGRVRGLILVGAPSDLQQLPRGSITDLVASFHDPVDRGDIDALNAALPLHRAVPPSFLEDQLTAALTIPRRVWQATIEGLLDAPSPIRTGSIAAPTLVLCGAQDDVLPAGQAEELADAIDGSRLRTYDGTGHLVLWEQPERVARDVVAFIAEQPRVG